MSLFIQEPRVSRSEFLSVVVERDVEAPDDPKAWVVVAACEGEIPEHLGAGYLHPSNCACVKEHPNTALSDIGGLCDIGWLEEFVSCAGVAPLLEGVEPIPPGNPGRLKLQGRMVSERIEGIEGTDYDESFECYSVEVLP